MNKLLKIFIKYVILFVLLIFLYNILLFLTSIFSSEHIKKNVSETAEILVEEGGYYSLSADRLLLSDNYTDALIINEAYSIDSSHPFISYMSARKNYSPLYTTEILDDTTGEGVTYQNDGITYDSTIELAQFANDELTTSVTYARYWHGYLVLYRPLLLLFNITQIRYILFMLEIILLIALFILLAKNFNKTIAIIFAIAILSVDFIYVYYSLENSPIFIITLIASIILIKSLKKINNNFGLYIFAIGSVANFVDYLTVPLISFGIPFAIYLLFIKSENEKINPKMYPVMTIKYALLWFLGYSLTWLSKWVLYDLFFNRNLIQSALYQVQWRLARSSDITQLTLSGALKLFMRNYLPIVFLFSVLIICMLKDNNYVIKFKENIYLISSFILIAIFPIVWYIALANHTVIHYHFVYRHMLLFVLGLLLATYCLFEKDSN